MPIFRRLNCISTASGIVTVFRWLFSTQVTGRLCTVVFNLMRLLYFSTCFEHYCAHLQEDNCISTASGIVTVFRWLFSTQDTRGLCTVVFILMHLLYFSTCFEHYCVHLQEVNCISTASGIVTLFRWPFSTQATRRLCTVVFILMHLLYYMFRALLCSSSGSQLYQYSIWYRNSL